MRRHVNDVPPMNSSTRAWLPYALAMAITACLPGAARADLQDEIQVYDDAINARGEFGLELHVNTTPRGRSTSDYPGEVPPQHAWRITPEFSYGLTDTVELGLYVPTIFDADGRYDVAGLKLRLKWLPLTPPEGGSGWFGGVNFELSRLARRYSESRSSLEARFIAGWRSPQWLLSFNPILGLNLSDGLASERPSLDLGFKVARGFAPGLAAGVELYLAPGALGRRLPWQQQDNRLYLALDVDRKPWAFNIAIGRALTDAADRWTLKGILDLPF
jgi:hypothetical protein